MDSVIDIVRMEVLTNASKKGKDKWKYLLLLSFLSNHRKILEQLKVFLQMVFFKLGVLRKCITPHAKCEPQPKSVVKLKFSRNEMNNKIFKEILNRHAIEFDVVQLRDPNAWHVIHPKTIPLTDDIFFRLDFEKPPAVNNETETKNSTEKVETTAQEQKRNVATVDILSLNHNVDLVDSRGQVFSYTRTLQELLDYLHQNYVPEEPTPKPIKIDNKKVSLFTMNVARVTRYDSETDDMLAEILNFTVSKNLDNIFLEPDMRERLMSQIDRFNDPVWYAERGLPRTLGILLHGQPGCGKTSFIKALCAYMKRKVVIVDFKLVTTVAQLRKIFCGYVKGDEKDEQSRSTYNYYRDETVYVFEDFDCMSEIFMDRKLKEKQDKEQDEKQTEKKKVNLLEEMLILKQMENARRMRKIEKRRIRLEKQRKMTKQDEDKKKSKAAVDSSESDAHMDIFDPAGDDGYYGDVYPKAKWGTTYRWKERVTLADFLELLDGIIEMDGRIIIMTTNQREKMDNALVRPGRIDLDLELFSPSRPLVCDIFVRMYENVRQETLRDLFFKYYALLPDKSVSTALVINCFMYPNPEAGLRALIQVAHKLSIGQQESDVLKSGGGDHENNQEEDVQGIPTSHMKLDETVETIENPTWTAESIWQNAVDRCSKFNPSNPENKVIDCYGFFNSINYVVPVRQSSTLPSPAGMEILDVNQKSFYFESNRDSSEPQWIMFDFGSYGVNIVEYTVVNANARWRLYNWNLEGSNDKTTWDVICTHRNDPSIQRLGKDKATFGVQDKKMHYRYIRLHTQPWSYYDDGSGNPLPPYKKSCVFCLKAIQLKGTVKQNHQ